MAIVAGRKGTPISEAYESIELAGSLQPGRGVTCPDTSFENLKDKKPVCVKAFAKWKMPNAKKTEKTKFG